jgi:hypothetical protein
MSTPWIKDLEEIVGRKYILLPGSDDFEKYEQDESEDLRFAALSPGTLRVPELVPHQAIIPGTEIVDPSKQKTFPGPEGWNPALRVARPL